MNQPTKSYSYHFVSPGHSNNKESPKPHQQYQFMAKKTQLSFKYPENPPHLHHQKSYNCPQNYFGQNSSDKESMPAKKYTYQMINKVDKPEDRSQCSQLLSPLEALPRQHPVIVKKGAHDEDHRQGKVNTKPADVILTPKTKSKIQSQLDSRATSKKADLKDIHAEVLRMAEENQQLRNELSSEKLRADKMERDFGECRELLKRRDEASALLRGVSSLKGENGRLSEEIKQLKTVIQKYRNQEDEKISNRSRLESKPNLINLNITPQLIHNAQSHESHDKQGKKGQQKNRNYQEKYRQVARIIGTDIECTQGHKQLMKDLQRIVEGSKQLEAAQSKVCEVETSSRKLLQHLSKQESELSKLHHINSILNGQLASYTQLIEEYNQRITMFELERLEVQFQQE